MSKGKRMVHLRPIGTVDIAEIKKWPAYGNGFEPMDYALRDHGWLDEYGQKPHAWIYAAELREQLIGFCLLDRTSETEAEFRIALHPHKTGIGLGKQVTLATLKIGFQQHHLDRIYLIVRKNNPPAAKLYENLGFSIRGQSIHAIQGKLIEFIDMDMSQRLFSKLNENEVP